MQETKIEARAWNYVHYTQLISSSAMIFPGFPEQELNLILTLAKILVNKSNTLSLAVVNSCVSSESSRKPTSTPSLFFTDSSRIIFYYLLII